MKIAAFALPLLFLSLAIFAAYDDEKALDFFVFVHLQENESFSVGEEISLSPQEAYLPVSFSSGDTVFISGSPSTKYGFQLLQDKEKLREVLTLLYERQGYAASSYSEIPKLKEYLNSFSQSRQPGEAMCRQYIGTDLYPCYDRDSCYKSCYTPLCNPLALGGGWTFIDLIVSFENDTDYLGRYLANANSTIDAFEQNPSEETFDASYSLVSDLNKKATKIKSNDLFDAYQLCYPVEYDMVSLVKAKMLLEKIERESLPFLEIGKRTEEAAENAQKRAKLFNEQKLLAKLNEGKINSAQQNKTAAQTQNETQPLQNETQNPPSTPLRIPLLSDFLDWLFSLF
ncbi:hypothetical protein COV61_03390 [Candidatus Micrarchaeota archaeon CG11_big_fil_rev_8_21_14_0_20_47_5]|nr:MAG: hypothetical protein AUJ17_04440 [Candidatus Micrarchaeota archaeon CG1_02_47_40]PIN83335.1 MAG: hypothetical protein COV61_03390 [Candidatus Micrarchaeota archaeon CG11_big_fil_rev_8_21_14_0_20_47_5]